MKDYRKETLCFGLDIGTRTVIGVVGYKEGNNFVLVDYECKEHEERAMLDGQIHDIQKVAQCVYEVKTALEKRLKITLTEVAIAAAGRSLSTQLVEVNQELEEEQEITLAHIHHLELEGVEMAKDQQQKASPKTKDYYCVAYSVISYYIDDFIMANLEGHRGKKIGAKLIATFLPKQVIDSLYAVTERAELTVAHLTLEPIAAINAVIPEQIRLLNLALVDIGAGTSDIAITKEGSVIAYGMIPTAGDEVTEAIVHKYLVDFQMAEAMKKQVLTEATIHYTDIIGISHEVSSEELSEVIAPVIENLAMQIAQKVILLNGDTAPNAVFCVGGGSQMLNLTKRLAHHLNLLEERVAVRSTANLVNVVDEAKMIDSPQMITPLGICMTLLQDKYSQFTLVTVNGQKIQLLNAKKLTILDAIIAAGIEHYQIFPKRGKTLMFKLNGATRRAKGKNGIPATILHNGKEAAIQEHIQDGDVITVELAVEGITPHKVIKDYVAYEKTVKLEGSYYKLPLVKANGNFVDEQYEIQMGDEIEVLPVHTVGELLTTLGLEQENQIVTRSFKPLQLTDPLLEGDVLLLDQTAPMIKTAEYGESADEEEEQAEDAQKEQIADGDTPKEENLYVIVNNQTVCLPQKDSDYIFAGIFDFIDFDLTKPQGTIQLTRNGQPGALTDLIQDGDRLEVYWKK